MPHPVSMPRLITAFSLSFLLMAGTAAAQQNIPTTVEPGRVQNDIRREMKPAAISTPAEISDAPDVSAPAGAEKVRFVLKKLVIDGTTGRLSQDQVAATYNDKINTTISLADIYAIANQITRLYRDNGYLLSRAIVPQQQIRDGVVHIQVIEGYISGYNIQGENFGGRDQIEAYAQQLVATGTLSAGNLERYLLLMNDLPGISVRSVLVPSKTAFGGANINLIVEQKKFEGYAAVDNYGNRFLGPIRTTLGGRANSVFGATDQLSGTFLWAPNADELEYYSGGYSQNIGNMGTRAGVNLSYTTTDPTLPDNLGGLIDPQGESILLGFNVNHPFIRSRATNLIGGLGFDVTRNKTDYDDPALALIETKDSQRIGRISGQFNHLDSYAGYNAVNATLSKGFDIFGASDKGDSNLSRIQGDPSFAKVGFEASRLQSLKGPMTVLFAMSSQFSFNPLLASEEFGFGGSQFGRGYDFSEITGDSGLAGKVELAYSQPIQRQYLDSVQPYVFYDIGKTWNRDPGAGQDDSESAASAGIGSRVNFLSNVQGDAFIAKPLTRGVTSRGTDADDWRFKFSLTSNF